MGYVIVFTVDGEVHSTLKLPTSIEYAQSYAYSGYTNCWYTPHVYTAMQKLHWSPINTNSVPEEYRSYIKLLKLLD